MDIFRRDRLSFGARDLHSLWKDLHPVIAFPPPNVKDAMPSLAPFYFANGELWLPATWGVVVLFSLIQHQMAVG